MKLRQPTRVDRRNWTWLKQTVLCADGSAHGVLLLNSNGMDVVVGRERASFRAVGGVLDLFVLLGPTPRDVLAQLAAVVGRPALPPFWSLGFHQSKCALLLVTLNPM